LNLQGENSIGLVTVIDGYFIGSVIKITADGVNISGFTIQNSGIHHGEGLWDCGIYVHDSNYNNIANNFLVKNGFGIWLDHVNFTTISENTIVNNKDGIELEFCYNNAITNNNVTSNVECGIALDHSYNNTVHDNEVLNNNIGIWVCNCNDNIVFCNSFVNNVDQTHLWNSISLWSSDDGRGNYWGNYIGTDTNHDGIGDSPYVINQNNADNYPLINTTMVPEFAPYMILPIFAFLTLFMIALARRRPDRKYEYARQIQK
jgi:parallel beta-helix repeat protein